MAKFMRFLLVVCFAFAINGCAREMALTKGQSKIDLSSHSVALLSVNVTNQVKPDYPLDLDYVIVCPPSWRCERSDMHEIGSANKLARDGYNKYLLSLELEPGTRNINQIHVSYKSFPIMVVAPLWINLEAEIKPNAVTYLGSIDVVLRKKKNEDEETAQIIPILDSAAVGFSDGTFDAVIEDKFDEDMISFYAQYPGLRNVKVDKSILPPWIRPENKPEE